MYTEPCHTRRLQGYRPYAMLFVQPATMPFHKAGCCWASPVGCCSCLSRPSKAGFLSFTQGKVGIRLTSHIQAVPRLCLSNKLSSVVTSQTSTEPAFCPSRRCCCGLSLAAGRPPASSYVQRYVRYMYEKMYEKYMYE